MQPRSRKFVLVHGGWHGGWCWSRVAKLLRKDGHDVFTPTLTGLCERSHLLTEGVGLKTHVDDVVNLLKWEDLSEVVLVGHSYGGVVISQVAEHAASALRAIVFLDAFLPENGQNLAEIAVPRVRDAIAQALAQGQTTLAPYPASVFNVNEADRAWVDAKCTPQPLRTFTDSVSLSGARDRIARKVYIRATAYDSATYDAALARTRAAGWRTYEVPCGHDVMIDMPERLAEVLVEAAG
jgi:pimeloyl-ACP methyl ester carboxylesterase